MTDARAWLDRVEPDDALPYTTTALRAVLDLHAEGNVQDATEGTCTACRDAYGDRLDYPCPTVTAITTALEDA